MQGTGLHKRTGLKKTKSRGKSQSIRVGGSSSEGGGAGGIHTYSQGEGEWGSGGAVGVRRKLEVRGIEQRPMRLAIGCVLMTRHVVIIVI